MKLEKGILDNKIGEKRKRMIEADRKKIQKAGKKENPLVTKPYPDLLQVFEIQISPRG